MHRLWMLSLTLAAAGTLHAQGLTRPSEQEATRAVVDMMQMPELIGQAQVKLGTCVPAVKAEHQGQIACTLAVKMGAATSETQADFYRDHGQWVAQPSVSQDKLPFPDPAL